MTTADHKTKLELVLTKKEARLIYAQGQEAVEFKLLELSRRIKDLEGGIQPSNSSTPSGQVSVYQKPPASRSRKKPGQKKGHEAIALR